MKNPKTRINNAIKAATILLIDEHGTSMGNYSLIEARNLAQERGLDLVEVVPNADPPVCKILNYGKYKYDLNKKQRIIHKKKKKQVLKEIRMQPKISEHDLAFKARHVDQFLNEGNKVKVAIRFRGRELAYTQLGVGILDNIKDRLNTNFSVDKEASMEGNFMTMLLSPSSKGRPKKEAANASPESELNAEKNKEEQS